MTDDQESKLAPDELMHYGILRKSGRYPWGSGEDPYQRSMDFSSSVEKLKKAGMSEAEIAKAFDPSWTTTELRAAVSIAKGQRIAGDAAIALAYKDKGLSNTAIGEKMGRNESSIRALLDPALQERRRRLETTVNVIRDNVSKDRYLDVGIGTEQYLGVARPTFKTAIAVLKDEGYKVHYINVMQLGTGETTHMTVLAPPGVEWKDVNGNLDRIKNFGSRSDDGGVTFKKFREPTSVDSKRLEVRYAEQGGTDRDGLIEIRPGAEGLDLGKARYAQVRIAVDGTHYLKGMAVYNPNLPEGVDLRFNTNKSDEGNKLKALKPMKDDPENPFGAQLKKGGQRGALNIVNEEGDWLQWSRNLSSQMLSKQNPDLAKRQLLLTHDIKKAEFEEILSLTNPTIKKELLRSFSDGLDAASVRLKAQGLPGTMNHVLLPVPEMKATEIYAPNYNNGDRVVLVRHPHGGIFEIPELVVNNRNKQAKGILGGALDAVGVAPSVAEQLSGADFDGDTVLVIPQKSGPNKVKTSRPLAALVGFDPKIQYKGYEGMKVMSNTQTEMGLISNLITDMTIQGATQSELARAVKHSMVVIDAEKHKLNYKQSYVDNGISQLKREYQSRPDGKAGGGASTLIARAKSQKVVLDRKPRSAQDGGAIDPVTGEKVFVDTGSSFVNKDGKTIFKTQKSTKLAETSDARTLVSTNGGTVIEMVYADHANRLKAMANQARLAYMDTPNLKYDPQASKRYAPEVLSLKAKLDLAIRNKPLERQAQLVANTEVNAKRAETPNMDRDSLKKVKSQALEKARLRVGAEKKNIQIKPSEWDAIQAGAVSNHTLSQILQNTDLDEIKKLATPRTTKGVVPAKAARAKAMAAAGYTQAEIADALGISVSTIHTILVG